jgi:hypothetical protein
VPQRELHRLGRYSQAEFSSLLASRRSNSRRLGSRHPPSTAMSRRRATARQGKLASMGQFGERAQTWAVGHTIFGSVSSPLNAIVGAPPARMGRTRDARPNDYHVMADGVIVGHIITHADARLRGDARCRDVSIRRDRSVQATKRMHASRAEARIALRKHGLLLPVALPEAASVKVPVA